MQAVSRKTAALDAVTNYT